MLKTRYAADTPAAEGISHLFDTLKSAPQSEIKAYFVHAALEIRRTRDKFQEARNKRQGARGK